MGGGGSKKNPLGYIGDAVNASLDLMTNVATLGTVNLGDVQSGIDSAGLNPSANKTKIENEQKAAEAEQSSRDAAIAENKTQSETAKKYAAKRAKQRGMAGASGGRSSTILTGLGDVSGTGSGSGKTLLGS